MKESESVIPLLIQLKEFPKYPEFSKDPLTINPDLDKSIHVDQNIYDMYEKSRKKNGNLKTYNELISFAENTFKQRERAFNKIKEKEKWFKKGIDHLNTHQRPFRENQNQEKDKIKTLVETYPSDDFETYLKMYENDIHTGLLELIEFIDRNEVFLKTVTSINIYTSSVALKEAIIEFDFLNVLHERSIHLIALIERNKISKKVRKEEFVLSLDLYDKYKATIVSPVLEKLLDDIESTLIQLLNKDGKHFQKDFYKKNGDININKLVKFAMNDYEPFYKKWVDEEATVRSYDKRSLYTYFSEVYELLKWKI